MFEQITVPDRTRPDTFPQEAELAWLGLNKFIADYNQLASILSGAITGTSATSLTISTGIKNFITQANLNLVPGYPMRAANIASPGNYMDGFVISYNKTTGALQASIDAVSGSGTVANWQIMVLPAAGDFASKSRNKFNGQQIFGNEVPVASATEINLSSITSNSAVITGVIAIQSVVMDTGALIECRFTTEVPLIHSTSLVIQGQSSYTTKPGDVAIFTKGNDNIVRVKIIPANGKAIKVDTIITKESDPTGLSVAESAATAAWVQSLLQAQATRVSKVIDGESHSYSTFITGDGAITQVGHSPHGVLGVGPSGSVTTPVKAKFNLPNTSGIKKVVRGIYSIYALFNNGEVYSCGYNGYGQLGHGDTTSRSILTRIEYFITNGITISDIFLASDRYNAYDKFFALSSDGILYACGYNNYGELGIGNTSNQPNFSATATGIANILKVVGFGHSVYILTSDGKLYSNGYNGVGQLGLGDTSDRSTFSLVTGFTTVADVYFADGRQGGPSWYNYPCVFIRLANGDIYGCGFNAYYNLGLGDTAQKSVFTKNLNLSNIVGMVYINGSYYASMAAWDIDGKIFVWGYNASGELGLGSTTIIQTPTLLVGVEGATLTAPPFQNNFKQIISVGSAEGYPAWAILDNSGHIWVCGRDNEGQLGSGRAISLSRFVRIPVSNLLPGEEFVSLHATGYANTRSLIALTNRGRAFGTGYNGYSQVLQASGIGYVYTLQPIRV